MAGMDVSLSCVWLGHLVSTLNITLDVKINVDYFAAIQKWRAGIISPGIEQGAGQADGLSGAATYDSMERCMIAP
ncbi:hypothetical protein ACXHXG_03970 [Rhizobium sp. LEGMi198b]